mgnify:CR=1 FL=1
MQKSQVVTHGGLTLDVSQIKSFHIDGYTPRERGHILRVELKSRYEYVWNPGTKEYEKLLINDFIEHPYADYETAVAYRDEWQEIWVDCLQENN